MSRLIIFITGTPNVHGHKRREFLWSPAHKLYLYEGKEIEDVDFNAKYELAMKRNHDMNPRIQVVATGGAPKIVERVVVKTEVSAPPPTMTIEDAVDVLARLAPEKLVAPPRKRGRPPTKVAEIA